MQLKNILDGNEYVPIVDINETNPSLRNKRILSALLKGQDGVDGLDGVSAYQTWLDLGNIGTEQDFINSLKGQDGYKPRGPYDPLVTYQYNDVVSINGSSWVSLQDNNLNNTPQEGIWWTLVAASGEANVDIQAIIDEVILQMTPYPVSIAISGLPSLTTEALTYQLTVTATYSDDSTKDVTNSVDIVYSIDNVSAGSINATGLFTAATVTSDQPANITATLTYNGTDITDTVSTTVRDKIPVSMTILGPTEVIEETTVSYSAQVTYSTGEIETINPATIDWNKGPGTPGVINILGEFTAGVVTSDTPGTIEASYTVMGGITVTDTLNITITAASLIIYPKYGVAIATPVANYDSVFVNALSGTASNSSITNTVTMDSGASGSGLYMYYAYPKAWGLAQFADQSSPGFYGGWDGALGDPFDPTKQGPAEVSVTIDDDTQIWYLYRTDFDGLGVVTWNVSPQP